MPRICIFGAGSVGCLIGGLLARSAEVTLIGRARIGGEIAAHGLTLTSLRGESRRVPAGAVHFATDASAAANADLVLVTVKSAATEGAGSALAAVLAPRSVVISFQNGVRNAGLLREHLTQRRVLAGMVPFNVVNRGESVFHRASSGQLMAESHPGLDPYLPLFAEAGLPLIRRDDMEEVQWGKLLLNLNNAINALSGLPLKEELARRGYRRCLALLQREALAVLAAAQIAPARLTPLPPRLIPPLLELPDALFTRLAGRMLAIDPLARSSTHEDLGAGRRTEIDYINGEIVNLAERLGLRAPANAKAVALIRAAEAGDARRFGADELLRELERA